MSVNEHLKDLYQHGNYLSVEWLLSEYILTHQDVIESMTLTKLANETGISKAAVSKFMKTMTSQGSYENFLLSFHYALKKRDAGIRLQMAAENKELENQQRKPLKYEEVKTITGALLKADKILFITKRQYESSLESLTDLFLSMGKKCRCVGIYYSRQSVEELAAMQPYDLVVMISPDTSIYEMALGHRYEFNVEDDFKRYKGKAIYIGEKGSIVNNNIKMFNVHEPEDEAKEAVYRIAVQIGAQVCKDMNY